MRAAVAVGLFTGSLAGSALADPPIKGACPTPGTVLQTSNGSVLTVIAATGLFCQMRSSMTGDFALIGLLLRLDARRTPSNEGIAAINSLWPLASGKAAQYTYTDATGQWVESYKVGAKRKVTTKAGPFQVIEIVQTEQSADGSGGIGTYTSYIAPTLGYIVKFTFTMTGGPAEGAPGDWELVSVKAP